MSKLQGHNPLKQSHKYDTLGLLVIKNILSYFEKHGPMAFVYPKQKKSGQRREMIKNQFENLIPELLNCQSRMRNLLLVFQLYSCTKFFYDKMQLKT